MIKGIISKLMISQKHEFKYDFVFEINLKATPALDVETMSQTLKDKNILPSNLKFGFLGLGIMGSGIVKNLINSGHSVIVWNRTHEKVCT